jgi:hypothetical protein
MNLREFLRFHLLKALLAFVAIQIAIVAIIQSYNHRPKANSDQALVIEGRSVKVTPLINDSDKDEDDELSIQQFSKPNHGSVKQKGNILYYSPDNNFVGKDSLTYTITDGQKESKIGSIVVQVNKNNKPVVNRDVSEAFCTDKIVIDVLRNDKDPEGDSIFIKGFSQPVYGHLNLLEGQLIYTAGSSVLVDSFSYYTSDGMNKSDSAWVCIMIKSKNQPCYPWVSCDVGDAAITGSFTSVNKTFVMEGSGTDIWNNADGFRFAYQTLEGDCEMVTKVESLEGTNEWAKAGIMVRESMSGGSKIAFVCVSNRSGTACHQRSITNESMEGGNRTLEAKAPYWIKLVRKGNAFSYYDSPDGQKWNNLGNAEVPMNKFVFAGFAVTSHNNSEIGKAVFSNYYLAGKVMKLR